MNKIWIVWICISCFLTHHLVGSKNKLLFFFFILIKRKQVSPNQKISTSLHSSSLYSPFKIHHCFISFWSLTRDMLFVETKNGYDNCISGSCRLREFLCSWEAQWRLCHSFKIILIKSYSHLIITIFSCKNTN